MGQNITIKLNAWIICAVLLITNLATIGFWQPWNNTVTDERTITVTGTTTIESEPDQFIFSPYYQKTGTDISILNTELSQLSDTIVAKLKELGVKDSAIKIDASSYDYGIYQEVQNDEVTATLSLTITLKDKILTQMVQDYLATTSPSGSITPQSTFSTAKQKDLETEARIGALKDARTKAETSTSQLGAKLGKVIRVSDITSGGITPLPWMDKSTTSAEAGSADGSGASSSYTIQPGLNEYSFSIEVTYEIN